MSKNKIIIIFILGILFTTFILYPNEKNEIEARGALEEDVTEQTYYKRFLPFNENVIARKGTSFYDSDYNFLFRCDINLDLIIYRKEKDYYGVEFNNKLLYVKKEDVIKHQNINSYEENAKSVPVLIYHFFYENNKDKDNDNYYVKTSTFKKQLKYLNDNNFIALKMQDLEDYLDKKIRIPENSVVITIDDGTPSAYEYAVPLLNEYKINATIFQFTSWYANYRPQGSEYVEIHSHTHNMHDVGKCRGEHSGIFTCISHKEGLEDLKKSRKILNGSPYLAYPFGDYSDSAIEILKSAGFTMAFTTENDTAKIGVDKYKIPRIYVLGSYDLEKYIEIINRV